MGGLVTLAQHGEHALAKFRQVRQCAFASKQLATEFAFKGLDGTRQSRLCHVAAFCGLGQIQRLADRQEVSYMVHFHSTTQTGTTDEISPSPQAERGRSVRVWSAVTVAG